MCIHLQHFSWEISKSSGLKYPSRLPIRKAPIMNLMTSTQSAKLDNL